MALITLLIFGGWVVETDSSSVGAAFMDHDVASWAADEAPSSLRDVMKVVTWAGASALVLPVLLILSLAARGREHGERVTAFLILAAIGLLLTNVVKHIVDRPRPAVAPLVAAGGSSFPSGHTTAGAILFASLAVTLSLYVRRRHRVLVWVGAAVGAVSVGASRVILGVHWTTDVIGGLLLGSAWVLVAWKASAHATASRSGRRVRTPTSGEAARE